MLGSTSDTLTRRKHWGGMQDSRRPSLLPMGGDRTNAPARSALGSQRQQPQQYQSPQWPDRPEYQEPEQSFDIKRAMASAIEAQLLPQEFNTILEQMGVVNQQERDQSIGEYSRELELYGDEMKRMEFERNEQAGIAKAGEERFRKDRKYGLDLAKGAREALGAERKFGLDLAGHELKKSGHELAKTKGRRQFGLDASKHDLEIAKTKAGQKEKGRRFNLDVAKHGFETKKFTIGERRKIDEGVKAITDERLTTWRDGFKKPPSFEAEAQQRKVIKLQVSAERLGGELRPGKVGTNQEGKFIIVVDGKPVDPYGKALPVRTGGKPVAADKVKTGTKTDKPEIVSPKVEPEEWKSGLGLKGKEGERIEKVAKVVSAPGRALQTAMGKTGEGIYKIGKKAARKVLATKPPEDTGTRPLTPGAKRSALLRSKKVKEGKGESWRSKLGAKMRSSGSVSGGRSKLGQSPPKYKGHETTIKDTDDKDYSKENIRKAAENHARRLANQGKRGERIKERNEMKAAIKNEDIPDSQKTKLYKIIDKAFKKIAGDY